MDRIKRAAQILYDARVNRRRIDRLPEDCIPRTLSEGYAVQSALTALIGDAVVGWKVGCTGPEAQKRAATTEPFSGPIFKRDLYCNGGNVPPSAYFTCALQVEFAYTLKEDLPAAKAPFALETVRDAIATVLPTLEIADSRYTDSAAISAPGLIADGAKGGVLIVGDQKSATFGVNVAEHPVALYVNGKSVVTGYGKNVMGDPLRSLQWLANSMSRRGEALLAGLIISTGTCTGSYYARPGDEVVADYGSLGEIRAHLSLA